MEIAKKELREQQKTSTELTFELGYSSPQHFGMTFKKKFGVSPNQVK